MARRLEATGDDRVLRHQPRSGFPLREVVVDTNTTGLNYRLDEIIEIGDVTGVSGRL